METQTFKKETLINTGMMQYRGSVCKQTRPQTTCFRSSFFGNRLSILSSSFRQQLQSRDIRRRTRDDETSKGLVTNYGEELQNGRRGGGGGRHVLPLRKGGGGSFSHSEEGAQQVLG